MSKEEQFQQILEQYKTRIFRSCYGYCINPEDAKDLYQEVLLRVWLNLDSFRNESAIQTWIFRITVNTALMFLRKEKNENRKKEQLIHSDLPEDSIPEKQEIEERLKDLYKAIHSLPENDRLIILMVLEDLSYKEIAETLGLNISNVGVKINRIKKQLLQKMTKTVEL